MPWWAKELLCAIGGAIQVIAICLIALCFDWSVPPWGLTLAFFLGHGMMDLRIRIDP